jgi:D-glycerate 3-kinase
MRLAELAGIEANDQVRACHAALDAAAPPDFRELAALLAHEWQTSRPHAVGLAGGQGAGKTTLSRLIESACSHFDLRVGVLSLDDFYLQKAERRQLAESVHPLLATRGPPGSHDMALCAQSLRALGRSGEIAVPVFDKGLDDRSGLRKLVGPFDLVILEGWCVGAQAVAELELDAPINSLEAEYDSAGVWRRFANRALAEQYAPVWELLEEMVFLRVPSLDAVRRWRLQQEQARPAERRMNSAQIERFVAHYERVTRAMLTELPARADWLVTLDEAHGVAGLSKRI